MDLTDTLTIERCKQLAEDINIRFGFNGTVFDKNNNVVAKSEGWANKVCPAIKSGDSRVICSSAQQRISKVAREKKEPVIEECDAGFIKFIIPIFTGEEFVGMVGGCGYLPKGSEVDTFYIGKLLQKEEGIKDLLNTVQHISQDKLTEAIRYIQGQVKEAIKTTKQ